WPNDHHGWNGDLDSSTVGVAKLVLTILTCPEIWNEGLLPGAENEDVWGQDRCCALELHTSICDEGWNDDFNHSIDFKFKNMKVILSGQNEIYEQNGILPVIYFPIITSELGNAQQIYMKVVSSSPLNLFPSQKLRVNFDALPIICLLNL
ncbi:hypothetical protein ACJX0J_031480, partial [Zea mays]